MINLALRDWNAESRNVFLNTNTHSCLTVWSRSLPGSGRLCYLQHILRYVSLTTQIRCLNILGQNVCCGCFTLTGLSELNYASAHVGGWLQEASAPEASLSSVHHPWSRNFTKKEHRIHNISDYLLLKNHLGEGPHVFSYGLQGNTTLKAAGEMRIRHPCGQRREGVQGRGGGLEADSLGQAPELTAARGRAANLNSASTSPFPTFSL